MESIAHLISALASLAWPLVFAVLLYKLFDPIRKLVESAMARKFTIKVAGNELSMEELSEQQRIAVSDLQEKVAKLEEQLMAAPAAKTREALAPVSGKRILWVDDRPKNNSLLMATLEERGQRIDTVLSTDEAMRQLERARYDAIISDMGRPENDHAGIELTRALREKGIDLPVYIYCGTWAASNLRDEAMSAGASGITSSASSLLAMLNS